MKVLPKKPHGTLGWLMDRHRDEEEKVTFGASEAASIMGDSPYTSRSELMAKKLGTPEVGVETPTFRKGNLIEPILVSEAGLALGLPIETPNVVYRKGRFTVTLDGVDCPMQPNIVVEAKTTARYRVRDASDLPREWLWQGYAQAYVTGAVVYFSVLDIDQNISIHKLPDNNEWVNMLVESAERLGKAIDNHDPSEVDDGMMTASTISKLFQPTEEIVELQTSDMHWLQQLVEAKELIAEGELLKSQAEDRIADLLRNATIGIYEEQPVVTWKQQSGRKKLDIAGLKRDHPELVLQYEKEGAPFRVMRTKNIKGRL
jgi:predicted phage-related endonuclease